MPCLDSCLARSSYCASTSGPLEPQVSQKAVCLPHCPQDGEEDCILHSVVEAVIRLLCEAGRVRWVLCVAFLRLVHRQSVQRSVNLEQARQSCWQLHEQHTSITSPHVEQINVKSQLLPCTSCAPTSRARLMITMLALDEESLHTESPICFAASLRAQAHFDTL
jgi:hypothetical protein